MACAATLCDEVDLGLDFLKRAIAAGFPDLSWIESDSELDPLRSAPRYADVIAPLRERERERERERSPAIVQAEVFLDRDRPMQWRPRAASLFDYAVQPAGDFRSPPIASHRNKRQRSTVIRFTESRVSHCCGFAPITVVYWELDFTAAAACRRWESNPHALHGRGILSPLRLPFRHSGVSGSLEATAGFEPANKGFADPRLTTWPRRPGGPRRRFSSGAARMERETGFEPATPTLARLCSTTELFPRPSEPAGEPAGSESRRIRPPLRDCQLAGAPRALRGRSTGC